MENIVEKANAFFQSHGLETTNVVRAVPHEGKQGVYHAFIEGVPSRHVYAIDGVEYNNYLHEITPESWGLEYVC